MWGIRSINCGNLFLRQKSPWWFDVLRNSFCMAAPTGCIPVAQDVKGFLNMKITGSLWTSLVATFLRSSARTPYWEPRLPIAKHCWSFHTEIVFVYFSLLSPSGGCLEWTQLVINNQTLEAVTGYLACSSGSALLHTLNGDIIHLQNYPWCHWFQLLLRISEISRSSRQTRLPSSSHGHRSNPLRSSLTCISSQCCFCLTGWSTVCTYEWAVTLKAHGASPVLGFLLYSKL